MSSENNYTESKFNEFDVKTTQKNDEEDKREVHNTDARVTPAVVVCFI